MHIICNAYIFIQTKCLGIYSTRCHWMFAWIVLFWFASDDDEEQWVSNPEHSLGDIDVVICHDDADC